MSFSSGQALSIGGSTKVEVTNSEGKVVATTDSNSTLDAINILTNGNSVVVSGLPAGDYTVTASSQGGLLSVGGSVKATINREVVDLDHFDLSSGVVTGNIIDGTSANNVADTFGTSYSTLQVNGYTLYQDGDIHDSTGNNVSGNTVSLQGDYGTLTLSSNGAYTYNLNSGVDITSVTHQESFKYTLTDIDGHSSTADLTINLQPTIKGSVGGDVATSTAYNDTLTLGEGQDTLIYKALSQDAQGGNGHDTWTDFSSGDKVDVSSLLNHTEALTTDNIGQYLSTNTVTNSDGSKDTVISVDRDGASNEYQSTELLTLKNTDTTLDDLLQHQQIVY